MKIFSGTHKGKSLKAPKGDRTRPTSGFLRETVFNICQGEVEGADFLDLFAGTGAMGLEALSRGARRATFVEKDLLTKKILKANIKSLDLENQSDLYHQDAVKALDLLIERGRTFDIIYVDPPYYVRGEERNPNFSIRIFEKIINSSILQSGGHLFIEDSQECPLETIDHPGFTKRKDRKSGRSVLRHFVKT